MSLAWLKMDVGWENDPKVLVFCRNFDSKAEGVLALIGVWGYIARWAEDGNAGALDELAVAVAVGWEREDGPGLFTALTDAKLMDDDGYLHGWRDRYKSVLSHREWRKASQDAHSDVTVTSPCAPGESPKSKSKSKSKKKEARGVRHPLAAAAANGFGDQVLSSWNETVPPALGGKNTARKLTKTRRGALGARIREGPHRREIGWWQKHFGAISRDKHCLGDNDRGWTANLDYALQEKICTRTDEDGWPEKEAFDYEQAAQRLRAYAEGELPDDEDDRGVGQRDYGDLSY